MSTAISPQDVAARIGLDPKELDKSCEERYLPSLAVFVHPYRLVFSHLLSPVDLDDVESENVGRSAEEKRLGCLRKWKARHGSEATFKVIVQAVLLSGYVDNAEAICRQLLPQQTGISGKESDAVELPNDVLVVRYCCNVVQWCLGGGSSYSCKQPP